MGEGKQLFLCDRAFFELAPLRPRSPSAKAQARGQTAARTRPGSMSALGFSSFLHSPTLTRNYSGGTSRPSLQSSSSHITFTMGQFWRRLPLKTARVEFWFVIMKSQRFDSWEVALPPSYSIIFQQCWLTSLPSQNTCRKITLPARGPSLSQRGGCSGSSGAELRVELWAQTGGRGLVWNAGTSSIKAGQTAALSAQRML